ncbi:MAG: hypothetical protein IT434_11760 [Phycisphaerales bacterium]|nr:hypothetical protein [Phycisphaerales bacterium]
MLTLNEADVRFLRVVVANPGVPSSMLPKLAEVSPRRAIALRKSLTDAGLLRSHAVSRAGKGREAIVLEVTPEGHRALQRAADIP